MVTTAGLRRVLPCGPLIISPLAKIIQAVPRTPKGSAGEKPSAQHGHHTGHHERAAAEAEQPSPWIHTPEQFVDGPSGQGSLPDPVDDSTGGRAGGRDPAQGDRRNENPQREVGELGNGDSTRSAITEEPGQNTPGQCE